MAKSKKIADMTLEELQVQKRFIKSASLGLGTVMLLAVIILLYFAFTDKNYALIGVAVGCSIGFLPLFMSLKQVNDEIKLRISK